MDKDVTNEEGDLVLSMQTARHLLTLAADCLALAPRKTIEDPSIGSSYELSRVIRKWLGRTGSGHLYAVCCDPDGNSFKYGPVADLVKLTSLSGEPGDRIFLLEAEGSGYPVFAWEGDGWRCVDLQKNPALRG